MELVKPAGSYWSDDQWKAIALSGGNMLVAAAAGSGKTAVLVERIIRKLTREDNAMTVDRLLVATFTKAAASEMRQRIREALEEALEKEPNHEHLKRQLAMLGRASITTLHSFCMEVIQRYYTLIPLDPGFKVASEHETELLRQEVLEELFEEKYGSEEEGGSFLRLVDWFSGERSDDAMFYLVQRLYDFSRSHPWPDHWLRSTAAAYGTHDMESLEHSPWVISILQDTLLSMDGIINLLNQALSLSLSPGGPAPYAATLVEDRDAMLELREAVQNVPWSQLSEKFATASFGKLKPVRKDQVDALVQDRVKALREEAKKSLVELREQLFGRSAAAFLEEMHQAAPLMSELAELVILFGERYQEEKRAKGWLDFSDLEHYALQILKHPNSTALQVLPSDAALEYQAQYEEVLLDEYQDTNTVQEMIVQLISRPSPGNRFMVGDVKQSIYRFRLAEPGLFLDKYRTYGETLEGEGMRIDLARNFRSRREVVGAVNMIFRQIMNEAVAEIDYDSRAELIYGGLFPEHELGLPQYAPELLLIDRSGEVDNLKGQDEDSHLSEEEEMQIDVAELEAVRLEARAIGSRIRSLLGEQGNPLMVYDKSLRTSRPARYGDIVILLRSASAWAPIMIQELMLEGIPASGELNQGYFQATEVETMLSMLKIIDNPQQDIPLAAVLRSPLVGLSEEELALLRLAKPHGNFYEAMMALVEQASAEEPDEQQQISLRDKLVIFLNRLNSWRTEARQGQLSRLVWRIYRETGYLDWVAGLPGGDQRQANLRMLHDRARQYERSSSGTGLFRFLRFIGRLQEKGRDLGAPTSNQGEEESVRIMTIHRSKGLEFPVVFVAGLAKQFNRQDMNTPFLMHRELGFGPKYMDEELRVSYPTLPNLAIRRRAQMELLAEEMRILYVALTRPKDKLILVSAVKDLGKAAAVWGQALQNNEEVLPDYLLARGKSYLDWIGPALIRHPAAEVLRDLAGHSNNLLSSPLHEPEIANWQITLLPLETVALAAAAGREVGTGRKLETLTLLLNSVDADHVLPAEYPESNDSAQEDLRRLVVSRLEWAYPYAAASHISAKTSVTELKMYYGSEEEPPVDAFEMDLLRQERAAAQAGEQEMKLHLRRPKFVERKGMTPTERGTAYHTVMQHIPFHWAEDQTSASIVEGTLQRLVERSILRSEQATEMDVEQIAGFLDGALGQMLRRAEWVRRELPFTYGLPADKAFPQFVSSLSGTEDDERTLVEMERELDREVVIIQGIVDCLFELDGRQILLDYKSDKVLEHRGGVSALVKQYEGQLELYAEAVADITGIPVEEKWLYFFDTGEAVRL